MAASCKPGRLHPPSGVSTAVQSGGAIINTNGFNVTIPSALTNGGGGGGLAKTGNGTLTLSASNNFTGGTTISGGTLALNNSPPSAKAPSAPRAAAR